MEFSLLADEPESVPLVATWYFDQWCKDTGRYTYEQMEKKLSTSINREQAPLILLAKVKGELAGAAELKIREMDEFPEYEYWIGGVYVAESHRGKGIAARLVDELKYRAGKMDITSLYLQTEDLTGGLYTKRGFRPIIELESKWGRVAVMKADLASENLV